MIFHQTELSEFLIQNTGDFRRGGGTSVTTPLGNAIKVGTHTYDIANSGVYTFDEPFTGTINDINVDANKSDGFTTVPVNIMDADADGFTINDEVVTRENLVNFQYNQQGVNSVPSREVYELS